MEQESKEKERMEKERTSFTTSTSTTSNEAETGIFTNKVLRIRRFIDQFEITSLFKHLLSS